MIKVTEDAMQILKAILAAAEAGPDEGSDYCRLQPGASSWP